MKKSIKKSFERCNNYALFLKQPLKLEMFVPCIITGGNLVIMEEPIRYSNDEHDTIELQLYNEAKERCLFSSFKYMYYHKDIDNIKEFSYHQIKDHIINWDIRFREDGIIKFVDKKLEVIEDILFFKPTLTQNALKQLE